MFKSTSANFVIYFSMIWEVLFACGSFGSYASCFFLFPNFLVFCHLKKILPNPLKYQKIGCSFEVFIKKKGLFVRLSGLALCIKWPDFWVIKGIYMINLFFLHLLPFLKIFSHLWVLFKLWKVIMKNILPDESEVLADLRIVIS